MRSRSWVHHFCLSPSHLRAPAEQLAVITYFSHAYWWTQLSKSWSWLTRWQLPAKSEPPVFVYLLTTYSTKPAWQSTSALACSLRCHPILAGPRHSFPRRAHFCTQVFLQRWPWPPLPTIQGERIYFSDIFVIMVVRFFKRLVKSALLVPLNWIFTSGFVQPALC